MGPVRARHLITSLRWLELPPQVSKLYSRFLEACARFKRKIAIEKAHLQQAAIPLDSKQTRLTQWM